MNTILLAQSSEWWDDTQRCHNDACNQGVHDFDVCKQKKKKKWQKSLLWWCIFIVSLLLIISQTQEHHFLESNSSIEYDIYTFHFIVLTD